MPFISAACVNLSLYSFVELECLAEEKSSSCHRLVFQPKQELVNLNSYILSCVNRLGSKLFVLYIEEQHVIRAGK